VTATALGRLQVAPQCMIICQLSWLSNFDRNLRH